MNFNSFILNEEILVNGKSLDTEEDKKDATPNYANDDTETGEEKTVDPPNDTPPPEEGEDDPDFTQDGNKDPDEGEEGGDPPAEEDKLDSGDEDPDFTQDGNKDPDEGEEGGDPPDTTDGEEDPDFTQDGNKDPDEGEEGGDPPAEGESDTPPPEEGEDDPDFTQDGNKDPEEGEEGDPPETTDGEGGGDPEIKQIEDELFSNLTPEQIAVKQTNLKELFITLYTNIERSIDRLAKVNRVEDNIRPVSFVTKKLLELKILVRDSLVESFDSRSYVENQILLQRQMAIFASLSSIIEELGKDKK